ncbi:MFS transporter [Avibacterium paragallinarum]|uniref:MFS transporter n=3 Tax=Avibacterium paragallinarum TaxID=728 RepID=A0AAE5TGG6_AVIPA|nr:MFS transporter [Avibacterium paragallinarum]MEE3609077.1 MFS transporter [Avibacterium paragallinarum]MEE3622283.1 MFS transporter [Avibacterium paragallinarum]MEE3669090.1 MFS transporter [Avibacterium paragallinarum]MEE3680651.1 MFS transporter [Avibacterium paragallinarum]MEE4386253.1 MFS transporter [Avibacterium paragallinarum]
MSILNFFKASPAIPLKNYTEAMFKSTRMKSFWAFSFAYAIYYVCRLSFNVAKPALVNNNILTPTELGVIGSAIFITYAVGKFVNSAVADHSNIVRYLSIGLFFSALCNFAMGMTTSAIALTLIWGFNGWVQSMGVGPCVVALSRWYDDKERGSYYGFWSVAHNVGEGITFIVTAAIITTFGWRFGFSFAGIMGLLGVLVAMMFMKDSPAACGFKPIITMNKQTEELDNKEVLKHQWDVIKNPAIWVLAVASCCMYIGRYGVNSWGVFFLENGKGYTTLEAASIISVNSIVGILGTIISGWLSDRFLQGKRNVMTVVVSLLNALSLAAFLFAPAGNTWFAIIALSVFGITLGIQLCFLGGLLATDISHKSASGIALGMMGVFGYAGAAAGEFLTGFMIDKTTVIDASGNKIYDFDALAYFWVGADLLSVIAAIIFSILVVYQSKK